MQLINLGTDDYSNRFLEVVFMLANHVSITLPTDQEIWDVLRQSEELPNASDVYFELALSKIKSAFNEKYPSLEFHYEYNNFEPHVIFNDELINGYYDLDRAVSSEAMN